MPRWSSARQNTRPLVAADPVVEAVQSFLLAESWEASRAVLNAQEQTLLGEEAQKLLRELAQEAREAGEERTAALIEEHRRVIERSRNDGIDATFAELGAPAAPGDLDSLLAELSQEATGPEFIPRRLELCRTALTLVERHANPELWALLQAALGTSLMFTPLGDRVQNLEEAIGAYESALEELTGDEASLARSRTLNNLGIAFERRLLGEADDNREEAIAAYEAALEGFTSDDTRDERAETLANLANAYNRREKGRRDDNRDRAIALYEEALRLSSDDDATLDRAQIRVNLGIAFMERASGRRVENLDHAIEHLEAALGTLDATFLPREWAHAQANLGTALQLRAATTGDVEDREAAIVAHEAALETYTDLRATFERATTLGNLGSALLDRAGDDQPDTVERAISCLKEAIRGLSRDHSPLEWGRANNNLGNAFRALLAGDRAENLEKAIAAYNAALEALTARNFPVEHAQAKKNLGTTYRERLKGAREDNLARAMDAYRDALDVRERIYGSEHPRVASVLYSMAKAQRLADDLEGAKESLTSALAIDEANPLGERDRLGRGYRSLADTARRLGALEETGARRLDALEEAETALLHALAVDEELRGPDDPDVFVDLRELSRVRRELGRDEDAAEALERAVTIEELSPSGADAGVRRALEDLAELTRKAGDLGGARRLLELAMSSDEAQYGHEHRRVGELQTKLDELLNEAQGVMSDPETLETAAAIMRRSRGRVPQRVAAAGATLSRMLDSSKRRASLSFEEELRGYLGFDAHHPDEGREKGRREATNLEVRMRIEIDDVNRFLSDPRRTGAVSGAVRCDRLGGERPIVSGSYNIVFERRRAVRRHVVYVLRFESGDGVPHVLNGQKEIDEEADDDLLAKMTDLRTFLMEDRADPEVKAAGIVGVRHLDFIEQLSTFRVDAATKEERLAALERFGRVALGPLWVVNARHVLAAAEHSSR